MFLWSPGGRFPWTPSRGPARGGRPCGRGAFSGAPQCLRCLGLGLSRAATALSWWPLGGPPPPAQPPQDLAPPAPALGRGDTGHLLLACHGHVLCGGCVLQPGWPPLWEPRGSSSTWVEEGPRRTPLPVGIRRGLPRLLVPVASWEWLSSPLLSADTEDQDWAQLAQLGESRDPRFPRHLVLQPRPRLRGIHRAGLEEGS